MQSVSKKERPFKLSRMNRHDLIKTIRDKRSFLCIGLDPDWSKIPEHVKALPDPIFEFNRQIIEATHDLCVAYKPNLAFFEAQGPSGLESFKKTLECIPKGILTIADAKRGDIGNTASLYAKSFFEFYSCDAITVNPYMGKDSVTPFLEYANHWTILLALTSNGGASDFQLKDTEGQMLYERVIETSMQWGTEDNLMYVVGATKASMLQAIRKQIPNHFLLVPGVGAQGGSLSEVAKYGMNKDCGLLVNASRSILFASNGLDFAAKAREEAIRMQTEMSALLAAGGAL